MESARGRDELGAILHEMISGKVPFTGDSRPAHVRARRQGAAGDATQRRRRTSVRDERDGHRDEFLQGLERRITATQNISEYEHA